MGCFIAEAAGHAAAAALDQFGLDARDQPEDVQDRRHRAEGLLVAVAVQQHALVQRLQSRRDLLRQLDRQLTLQSPLLASHDSSQARAFELLHKLGKERLVVDGLHETVNAWVTRDSAGVSLLLVNHALPRHSIGIPARANASSQNSRTVCVSPVAMT